MMDFGQLIYILSRLILGGLASFMAIMLWARTRDTAWMLVVMATIAFYGETIYAIVNLFMGDGSSFFSIGTMPVLTILLHNFPMLFLIAAFAVMVARKYRSH